jgi:tungstate transport system permease protein
MVFWWHQVRGGVSLIVHGNPELMNLLWVTVKVTVISTAAAVVIGLPAGLALGVGRFRGRRALQVLANTSMALPSVVVGIVVLLVLIPEGPLGSWHLALTLRAVYIAQTLLALPYVVALTPAAVQALPAGLLDQARALGAGRAQLAALVLREARIGIAAAVVAALGAAVSEAGAVAIVGGGEAGRTQTLASSLIGAFTYQANDPLETGTAILLAALVLVLLGTLSILATRGGLQLRWRSQPAR